MRQDDEDEESEEYYNSALQDDLIDQQYKAIRKWKFAMLFFIIAVILLTY